MELAALERLIFRHTLLTNCEAYKIETRYTHGQWADVSCIPESGCCCLFVLYFFLFFLSNFQTLKFFVTLLSGTVRPRRLKLGTHVDSAWTVGSVWCKPESGCCVYRKFS